MTNARSKDERWLEREGAFGAVRMNRYPLTKINSRAGFWLAFVAILLLIAYRNSGLYPIVLSDEYRYSTDSRLKPLGEAVVPAYLYLAVFRLTQLCDDGFLECARILNLVFFAAASPFIFGVARLVAGRAVAATICVLALASPFNAFTAYYMPESMYYFGFWLLAWQILRFDAKAGLWNLAAAGSTLGLLALVKPHALFLLPSLLFYLAWLFAGSSSPRFLRLALRLLVFCAAAVAAKVAGSLLIGGTPGLSLFGPLYRDMAAGASIGDGRFWQIATGTWVSLQGHVMALALLYAMPLAILGAALPAAARGAKRDASQRVALFAALSIVGLMLVASVFTAAVNGSPPYETLARLHMRYYDFCFPLLLMIGATSFRGPPIRSRWQIGMAIFFAVVLVYGAMGGLLSYAPSVVDSPEVSGITSSRFVAVAVTVLGLISLALLCFRPAWAPIYFLFAFFPLALAVDNYRNGHGLQQRMKPDVYDRAGLFVRRSLPPVEAGKVHVIGDDGAGVYRALFHIDNPRATSRLIDAGSEIDASLWPEPDAWVLVVGDHRLHETAVSRIDGDGFFLARRTSAGRATAPTR